MSATKTAEQSAREWLEDHWKASDFGEHVAIYDDVDGLTALLEAFGERVRQETSELCADHVIAQHCVADSGMPASAIITKVAATFRSNYWLDVCSTTTKTTTKGEP